MTRYIVTMRKPSIERYTDFHYRETIVLASSSFEARERAEAEQPDWTFVTVRFAGMAADRDHD